MTTNTTAKAFDFTVKPTPQGTFQICYRGSGNCYPTEYLTGIAAQNAINSKFGLPPIVEPSPAAKPTPEERYDDCNHIALTDEEIDALRSLLTTTVNDNAFSPKQRRAHKHNFTAILNELPH